MVSLHTGRFVVYAQVFLSAPRIFPEGQIFTKNYHFWRFLVPYCSRSRTASFIATTLKFRTTVRSWGFLFQANIAKIA